MSDTVRPPAIRPYPIHPAGSGWIPLRRSWRQRLVDALWRLIVITAGH